jgi:hypothetical protein
LEENKTMKIILDNKFNIVDVEDTLDELLVKGSNRFDRLAVFIPTALKEQYESIYPTYAVKRADGREAILGVSCDQRIRPSVESMIILLRNVKGVIFK